MFHRSLMKLSAAVGVILLAALLFAAPTRVASAATTYFVNADVAGGADNGSSWANAFDTLQDALAVASSGDQIWVAAGIYYPDEGTGQSDNARSSTFQMIDGVKIYGGFAGTEANLNERNIDANLTVLSGDLDQNDPVTADGILLEPQTSTGFNAYHVVSSDSSVTTAAILDGFTITAGRASSTGTNGLGGGIYNDTLGATVAGGNSPLLVNLRIVGNYAGEGGGMYSQFGNPKLVNVGFYGNYAEDDGGGMYTANDSDNFVDEPVLFNVLMSGNEAGLNGGGLYNGSGTPDLINVTIANNTASGAGGGIFNVKFSEDSILDVSNSILWNNSAPSGAQYLNFTDNVGDESFITFSDTTIQDGCTADSFTTCTNILTADPDFQNPIGFDNNFGTLDDDYNLRPASGAVDLGDNSKLIADIGDLDEDGDTAETIPLDFAGNPRLDDGDEANGAEVDQGAYELALDAPAPTNLQITYIDRDTELTLTWDDTPAETAYVIELSVDGGQTWDQIGTTTANVTSFVDVLTCAGNTADNFAYRVYAEAGNVRSPNSNVADLDRCDVFGDIPYPGMPPVFEGFIEDYYYAGLTNGKGTCVNPVGNPGPSDLTYCPLDTITRAEIAVFILRGRAFPLAHTPTGDSGQVFADVPDAFTNTPPSFELWIEDYWKAGLTNGCGPGTVFVDQNYCPEDPVDRAQIAVFTIRALDDVTETDVSPNPFIDVPSDLPAPFMEPFVETFFTEGITSGKGNCAETSPTKGPGDVTYCPQDRVTRQEIAVFLLRAFSDTIPGPNTP